MHQPGAKSEMPVEAVMRVNKRQMYLQSCGAATLLCAAMELGVRHLPNLPGSILSNGQPRNADGTCESAIHQITSGAATGGNARLMPNQNTGYSIPYSLALAAQLLGLDVRVHMLPGLISSSVSALYRNVESLCGGSGVPVDRGPLPRLAYNLSPITHHGRVAPGASPHLGALRRQFYGSRDRPNLSFHRQCLERVPFYAVGGYTDTGISVVLMSAPVIDATVFRQSTRDRLRHARFGGFHELPF